MKKVSLIAVAALVGMLSLLASSALAEDGGGHHGGRGGNRGVIKTGACSASAHWKLKAKSDDGRIETEFEVDQNRVGKRWRVTISRNGSAVFRGIRTTTAPSGSFEVRRLLAGSAAGSRIVATAKSLQTGETCRAALAL
jgi:hypothetical protein